MNTKPTPPLSPLGSPSCSLPSSSGISYLLGSAIDDRQPMRLLPLRRHPAAILPLVGSGAGTAKDADKLRGGNIGKVFLEGHGQILPKKKKCAMQKKLLAMHTWRGYLSRVSQPQHKMKTLAQTEAILNRKFFTNTEEDTLARFIAHIAFNQYGMSAEELVGSFEHIASWNPAVIAYDAPIRQAKLSTAASSRVKRNAVKYVREWSTRREQGAN